MLAWVMNMGFAAGSSQQQAAGLPPQIVIMIGHGIRSAPFWLVILSGTVLCR